jgi:dipeptidyl aminopeptidase/acylaminoacyl peptidase
MTLARTPLVPSDIFRLVMPGDPRIASDASVLYERTTLDEESDATFSAIWRVELGKDPVPFTFGKRDRMPRACPNGDRLAFVGDRGDGKRVYTMSLRGGEAFALTPAYTAISALAWSPDSARIAYVATADHAPQCARIAHDERSGARHIRGLPFKSDEDGLFDGKRKHLFVCEARGGRALQATHGDFDVEGPVWSPCGKLMAFSARIGQDEHSFISDIHVLELATGELRKLTGSNGPMDRPSFSHSGGEIAFVGHEHGDSGGGRRNIELFVVDASGGAVRSLTTTLDRTVGNAIVGDARAPFIAQEPIWSADDAEIFVLLSSEGASSVVAFARESGGRRVVVGGQRDVIAFSRASDGAVAFVYGDPTTPGEVGLLTPAGDEHQLTRENPWLIDRLIRAPRRLRLDASDGTTLDLFLLEPDHTKDAPLVVEVHGGPHAAYGFTFMFEFQMLAGHGIGVAYGNPRGSQSYGHVFADGTHGDWGGGDARDVLTFLDAAQAAGSWDHARVGIAGGSYGGFMTTWQLAHSKRFKAGVSMRAVNDFVSEVGASDCGWFLEDELGLEWDGGRALFEQSPMRHAHHIEAPLLILHSERDYRCPIDQGEQLFTLLRRLGRKNVEFVRFTGDGHNLSRSGKPRNRMLRLRAIAHWFIRHLRPNGTESIPDEAGWLLKPLATEVGADEASSPGASEY